MKYHTSLGSNNLLTGETKTSGFTAYADIGLSENNKMCYTERDFVKFRKELENVQHDLKLQTKRCRHLVDEFTRKLQEKEQLFQNEKSLRDTQLAKVLKALLIFEARLRQEQKLISHQLNEKDYIIKTQNNDIKKLLSNSYCKNCNQYFATRNLESLDSGSEYAGIENGYQSSNLESLDSSSETYGAVSSKSASELYEKIDNGTDDDTNKTQPYFQVLKLRNDSPMSNDDNTSADYDNLDSLPPESVSDKISLVSSNIEDMLTKSRSLSTPNSDSSLNISSSDCNKTVITAIQKIRFEKDAPATEGCSAASANPDGENKLLTDRIIPVFESTDDGNDKWYASASDQEDEDHSNVYRNNPVLECMNQILLQNIDDLNSPPKTPNIERKTNKNNKRVKFSDEECTSTTSLQDGNLLLSAKTGYYEIPIQATANYYETPQSIYSNDYEQILSNKSSECGDYHHQKSILITKNDNNHHHYIEMEKEPIEKCSTISSMALTKKNKILRVPPALPPKPPNLVAKCKITPIPKKPAASDVVSDVSNCDLEPDYCSISELNLPPNNKISVIAEVHISPTSQEIKNRLNVPSVEKTHNKKTTNNNNEKDEMPALVVKKCVEKFNIIDLAKQTPIKLESSSVHNNNININKVSPKKKQQNGVQIPKLPQVSEIIIPDDPEDGDDDRISQDNYIKNCTQILNDTNNNNNNKSANRDGRKPVVMGSSVSSIINGFNNNNQFIDELKRKHERINKVVEVPKKGFSGFENVQNLDKSFTKTSEPIIINNNNDTSHRMDSFDLSQNFEEFKLDDCEIEEYDVEEELEREEKSLKEADKNIIEYHLKTVPSTNNNNINNKLLENNKADLNLSKKSIEQFKRQLQIRQQIQHHEALNNMSVFHNKNNNKKSVKQPTYDHFLECTGLSTKSILTSSNVVQSHKNMLKFNKDIKVRSKVKANANIFEKLGQSRGNYWSEPFV